ncbi:MAG: hypothetical protein EA415_11500 [Sphaerobacteraceae bacterium]|nr:MAG: hypothetical protein EA415_11500 [Sphaerobacteraceae bacterium]
MNESNQPEPEEMGDPDAYDQRQVLNDVRKTAGWRVSPRHIDVAMIALDEVGEEPSIDRVAEIVTAFHGDGSKRQKRNSDLWRLLGAQLTVRGKPGGPDDQLKFIGRAKSLADEQVSDSDLLMVATALAGAKHPLTPEITADATTWIIDAVGPGFDAEQLDERLDKAVEAAMAERAERANKRRRDRT